MLCMAFTLSGSAEMPSLENTNPKNVRDDLLNSHLDLLRVRFTSSNFLKTLFSALLCFFLGLAIHDDIITYIQSTRYVTKLVTDDVLESLTG